MLKGAAFRADEGGQKINLAPLFFKPYLLRKWLGLALVGAVGCVAASQIRLLGFDLGLLSVFAVAMGMGLFMKRRRFEQVD
ncbi:hypothetical protein [Pseudomonas sp. NFACC37-1]|uniref:hypothetical protein n=1 Tax=Pseudomonas sp. NFACC37-1 TaxID=1566196 RepID=UPI00087F1DC9|nr:hypothetical protein [Pseudomonas sp. NFACC37-1]SCY60818.1 hypothetical protein SAMN03159391_02377 [Pseudomonas sp. NFACC37-1]